eukprot:3941919-Rhodomonas_salina.2
MPSLADVKCLHLRTCGTEPAYGATATVLSQRMVLPGSVIGPQQPMLLRGVLYRAVIRCYAESAGRVVQEYLSETQAKLQRLGANNVPGEPARTLSRPRLCQTAPLRTAILRP